MSSDFRAAHFSKKHLLIARLSRMCDGVVYRQKHGLARGFRRQGGLGFMPAFLGSGPTKEEAFLESLDLSGQTVYDVGAFQGLVTLFFCRKAGQVISYEANPRNADRVRRNLELNQVSNCILRNVAVGEEEGSLKLTVDPLMPGAGSADAAISGQISDSSKEVETFEARVVALDQDRREQDLPPPDFVKVDRRRFLDAKVARADRAGIGSKATPAEASPEAASPPLKSRPVAL